MQILSDVQINQVAGGALSVHINATIPLNYLPIITQFIEASGGLDELSSTNVSQLVNALNAAGLDPSLLKIDFNISYYPNYM